MERLDETSISYADPKVLNSRLEAGLTQTFDFSANQLRQEIRTSITEKQSKKSPNDKTELQNTCGEIVSEILSSTHCEKTALSHKLERAFDLFSDVYEQANIPKALRTRRYICKTGLVISPDDCRNSIKDTLRIHAFTRSIDQAISQQLSLGKKSLHIIYPACGPFAPLLLPLIAYYHQQQRYTPQQLRITLVDIQEGACTSLKAVVQALGISQFIEEIHCANAQDYHTEKTIDMVVLEAIQHGFSREGHLFLAKHYADLLAEDGILLPQEIQINAGLNIAQREFVEQWQGTTDNISPNEFRNERIDLGVILKVDLRFLRTMQTEVKDEFTQLLKCNAVLIPNIKSHHDKQILLIHSKVIVFGENHINEYDSGITHPLPDLQVCINFTPNDPQPSDLLVKSGDTLRFYYCMNGLPGFLPIKEECGTTEVGIAHA